MNVETFLRDHQRNYLTLLQDTKAIIEEIANDYPKYIQRIYSRAKSSGESELKTPTKIDIALTKLKQKPGQERSSYTDIRDIIGLTVVIYYSDYLAFLTGEIIKKLGEEQIHIHEDAPLGKMVHRGGYYAQHLEFISRNPRHSDLYIEVQIKTMLHDAMGAKTHDLIYKPMVEFDGKLRRLFQSLGDSIQAIEIQSEQVRNLIEQRHVHDQKRRYTARLAMTQGIEQAIVNQNALNILSEIRRDSTILSSCDLEEPTLKEKINAVRKIENVDIKAGCFLITLLATYRSNGDLNYMSRNSIKKMRDLLMLSEEPATAYIWAASLLYLTGSVQQAIEELRHAKSAWLLKHNQKLDISDPDFLQIVINLTIYLLDALGHEMMKSSIENSELDELIHLLKNGLATIKRR